MKSATIVAPASVPSAIANATSSLSTNFNGVAQSSSFANFVLLHHELTVRMLQAALERAEKEERDASDRAFLVESSIILTKQLSLSSFNVGL